jgi:hypothetical protein
MIAVFYKCCRNFLAKSLRFAIKAKLEIWPLNGNMLGGEEVNITGPCFGSLTYFLCKWGDGIDSVVTIGETTFYGEYHSDIKGRCIQPAIFYNGRLNLSISLDSGETYHWKAEYNIGKFRLFLQKTFSCHHFKSCSIFNNSLSLFLKLIR